VVIHSNHTPLGEKLSVAILKESQQAYAGRPGSCHDLEVPIWPATSGGLVNNQALSSGHLRRAALVVERTPSEFFGELVAALAKRNRIVAKLSPSIG
jgi:hypothetical protein